MPNTAISPCQKLLNNLPQLSFSFQNSAKFLPQDFLLLGENAKAHKILSAFFARKTDAPSLILKGPQACGKTHLLHLFAEENQIEFLLEEEVAAGNLSKFFAENNFYVLEDFDLFEDEELLLRLINCASEAKAFLLLTAKNLPKVKIKDLASRLKNIVCAEIAEPSLDSMKQLLVSGLARRQIKLSNEALDFILLKIERSYAAIFAALKLIENAAAHEKLSAKKIREIFG